MKPIDINTKASSQDSNDNLDTELFYMDAYFPSHASHRHIINVDVFSDANSVFVIAEVPGVKKSQLHIDYNHGFITIRGKKSKHGRGVEDEHRHSEIAAGNFQRRIDIGTHVDIDNAQAELDNGVLKITIPKQADPKANKIEIN